MSKITSHMNDKPSEIKMRMVEFIKSKEISLNKFYKTTKISNGSLTKSGNITINTLVKFLDFFPDANLSWIIRGDESMSADIKNVNELLAEEDLSEYKTNYDLKSLHILNEQLQIKDRQITELHTIIKEILEKD
ncbi:hypothetical protein N9E30_01480 [Flavobacteriales bacterium]|jgi:hypothetical protein|nr:hypothetical protein [Flavobacteriales bacterium]